MDLAHPDAPLVGKLLDGRYELLEVIADGGVGTVYRARQTNLERIVAIKVLHDSLVDEVGFIGRFKREAVAMSRLYHPHCVAVIDSGVYQSRPYLVVEYLPGHTIRDLLKAGPFESTRAARIALQLLETLDYFHSHHVIHRDLKSENVMLVESSGTKDFVKVLDFGMAKILTGPGADSQLSNIGIVPGTPGAMAPEQIYQLPPDPRIDIYATGILLYEMLVGFRPFRGDMAAVVKMQISAPPKPPRSVRGEQALSVELEQVVLKALQKDRVDRFGTASEMAAALRRTPEGRAAAIAEGSSLPPRARRPQPRAALLAAAGALGLLAAAAVLLWPSNPPPQHALTTASPSKNPVRTVVPVPAPAPQPAPDPARPKAASDTESPVDWLAHRDLAIGFAHAGQRDDALAEIHAALAADAVAAGHDPELTEAAVSMLGDEQAAFVLDAFGESPQLARALLDATAHGTSAALRHAAFAALSDRGQAELADTVAMQILDIEQATSCSRMRVAFKRLRATADPRVKAFKAGLRARGRRDKHVHCLRRLLR